MFMFELKISHCIFPSASYVIDVVVAVVIVHITSFSYFKCMSELTDTSQKHSNTNVFEPVIYSGF